MRIEWNRQFGPVTLFFFHPDPAYSELYYCPWASSCERRRVRRWAHGRVSTLVKAMEGIGFFESSVNGQSLTGRCHGQLTDLDLPLRSVAGDKAIYFISFFFMSNDCRRILADTGELCTKLKAIERSGFFCSSVTLPPKWWHKRNGRMCWVTLSECSCLVPCLINGLLECGHPFIDVESCKIR